MRVKALPRISLRRLRGSSVRPLIPLDDALPICRLQARAQLAGLVGRQGPDHGAVVDALGAEIDLTNQRLFAAELARVLGGKALERRLRLSFAALRRNLHRIGAATVVRRSRGLDWRGLRRRGDCRAYRTRRGRNGYGGV